MFRVRVFSAAAWLVLTLLGSGLVVAPARAAPTSRRQGGSLFVRVVEVPTGRSAAIVVRGPSGVRRVARSRTLKGLRSGVYTVMARPIVTPAGRFYPTVASCADVASCPATSRGRVRLGRSPRVTVYVVYATVVSRSTRVLSASTLRRAMSGLSATGQITFKGSAPLPFVVGSIIVAAPGHRFPYGLLRRVTGIRSGSEGRVVSTTEAALVEAVPRGAFDVALDGTASSGASTGASGATSGGPTDAAASRVHPASRARSASVPTGSVTLTVPGTKLSCGNGAGVSPTGSADVSLAPPQFSASWGSGEPTLSVSDSIQASASVSLTAEGNASCSLSDDVPGGANPGLVLGTVSIPGLGVPVWVTAELVATVGVSGEVSEKAEVSASASASATAAVTYAHGALTRTLSGTHSVNSTHSVPGSSGSVALSIGPKLYLDVDDVRLFACEVLFDCAKAPATPAISLTLRPTLTLQKTDEPWWRVDAPVVFSAALEAPLFHVSASAEYPLTTIPLEAPPGRPTDVTVTPGVESLTVGWQPPPTDPSPNDPCACVPVDSYDVYLDGKLAQTVDGTTETTLTGLTEGKSYEVSVSAVGRGGYPLESLQTSPIQATAGIAPTPPPSEVASFITGTWFDDQNNEIEFTQTGPNSFVGEVVAPGTPPPYVPLCGPLDIEVSFELPEGGPLPAVFFDGGSYVGTIATYQYIPEPANPGYYTCSPDGAGPIELTPGESAPEASLSSYCLGGFSPYQFARGFLGEEPSSPWTGADLGVDAGDLFRKRSEPVESSDALRGRPRKHPVRRGEVVEVTRGTLRAASGI